MSKLLTLKEVCERLRLHENTVREYINESKIPAIKLDRVWRVEEKDLEKFIKARKRRANR